MANLHSPKLTASRVKSAPAGKYTDGHGLMLWVKPTGTRSWVQRLVIQGKRRDMGLGAYPLVSLAEARDMAFANRKIARAGGDPRHQQATSKAPTFEEATRKVHAIHAPTWKNDKQRAQWLDEVARIVFSRDRAPSGRHHHDGAIDGGIRADLVEQAGNREPGTATHGKGHGLDRVVRPSPGQPGRLAAQIRSAETTQGRTPEGNPP